MANLKGFKVTDSLRQKIYGVACTSLKDVIFKGRKKLKLNEANITVYLQDGTLVETEDYFRTLEPQTILIFSSVCPISNADLIYNALKLLNLEMLNAGEMARDFFDEDIKEKVRVLSELVDEEKEQDFKKWVGDVKTNFKTKEDFMEARCRDRIRGYYYKTTSTLKESKEYNSINKQVLNLLSLLKNRLVDNKFEGAMFNRKKSLLCNKNGTFICGGSWKYENCKHINHSINPYLSREKRIIFSTWDLDHRIERSRSIIPGIIKLLSSGFDINDLYAYKLLFTTDNLKLVHIVCHDKGAHDLKFDTFKLKQNGLKN